MATIAIYAGIGKQEVRVQESATSKGGSGRASREERMSLTHSRTKSPYSIQDEGKSLDVDTLTVPGTKRSNGNGLVERDHLRQDIEDRLSRKTRSELDAPKT